MSTNPNQPESKGAGAAPRPTVVYVLASTGPDYYAEMAAVSAWLLRRVQPEVRVHLLVDEVTHESLDQRKALILDLCDRRERVNTGLPTPRERAWCIKSMMRQVVPGDFLFLDVDALPVRPLSGIWEAPCDMAAVLDRHAPPSHYKPSPKERELYARMNWRFPPAYYNSGVVLLRDTPGAHRLGREWAKRWRQAHQAGEIADQFSLNSVLADMALNIATLPPRYNAQAMMRRSAVRGAAIIHIFTVNVGPQSDTVLGCVAHSLKTTGKLDEAALNHMQETGYPWADENWISGQLAMGRYGKAMGLMALKALGRKPRTGASPAEAGAGS